MGERRRQQGALELRRQLALLGRRLAHVEKARQFLGQGHGHVEGVGCAVVGHLDDEGPEALAQGRQWHDQISVDPEGPAQSDGALQVALGRDLEAPVAGDEVALGRQEDAAVGVEGTAHLPHGELEGLGVVSPPADKGGEAGQRFEAGGPAVRGDDAERELGGHGELVVEDGEGLDDPFGCVARREDGEEGAGAEPQCDGGPPDHPLSEGSQHPAFVARLLHQEAVAGEDLVEDAPRLDPQDGFDEAAVVDAPGRRAETQDAGCRFDEDGRHLGGQAGEKARPCFRQGGIWSRPWGKLAPPPEAGTSASPEYALVPCAPESPSASASSCSRPGAASTPSSR